MTGAESATTKRFPFINIERALDRAARLYAADKSGRPLQLSAIFEVFEYSEKSSGGFQTIAALRSYGLIESAKSGDACLFQGRARWRASKACEVLCA